MSFMGVRTKAEPKKRAGPNEDSRKKARQTDALLVDDVTIANLLRVRPPSTCMTDVVLQNFEYVEANVHDLSDGKVAFALGESELPERVQKLNEDDRPMLAKLVVRDLVDGERGVFACEDIPKSTFVCEYTGLYKPEGQHEKTDSNYLFTFREPYPYALDASHYGNVARYINHSKTNANLEPRFDQESMRIMQQYLGEESQEKKNNIRESAGRHLPRIFLYSTKVIKEGEQLLYDYGDDFTFPEGSVDLSLL